MARIRVRNATGLDLDWVRVFPPQPGAAPVEFGQLRSGATSGGQDIPGVYRYAHIEVCGPAGPHVLRPYDYVGEQPLPSGEFVY
jgi:hypothetical protein